MELDNGSFFRKDNSSIQPVVLQTKKKKFFNLKNVLWFGVLIGIGICSSILAMIDLYVTNDVREAFMSWHELPWQMWLIVFLFFLTMYLIIKYKINQINEEDSGKENSKSL